VLRLMIFRLLHRRLARIIPNPYVRTAVVVSLIILIFRIPGERVLSSMTERA
jgi:hypothetical protein